MATDPLTKFLARFSLRDLGHALSAYVATVLPTLTATNVGSKAFWLALIPAAATVLYRQIFPHTTVSASEVNTAVSIAEKALAKAGVTSPVLTRGITVAGADADKVAEVLAQAAPAAPAVPLPAAPGK